ncbi:MAG: PKD domain-containing protein [Chitinophagaceae bacterium]|nr:PKD domain-containing protein [Chitinophagaceae bacterium]
MRKLLARYLLLSVSILFAGSGLIAQDFSNKGKEFWIAYPAHIDGTGSVMGIYLTSDKNATGQVNAAGNIIPFTITANQVTRIFLGGAGNPTNANVYLNMQDGIKTNAAIKITSDNDIVVYTHIIRSARSGATLALPTPVLGIEYTITNFGSVSSSASSGDGSAGGISQFAIVATLPNTTVEINPTANGIAGKPAGVPFQITLANAGDCYQFQSVSLGDLSGTTIKSISNGGSCKPVAVFSGSTWTTLDCAGASGGDNLYQQLFPNRSWGKQFVTAPFINRPFDIYRVYVQDPSTVVTYTDNGITNTFTPAQYNSTGKYYQYKTTRPLLITGDKPIQVVQYIASQTCKTGCTTNSGNQSCFADPEMVVLNSVEQTLSDVTFFSAHQNYVPAGQTNVVLHFVNIIINKNFKASVKVDGAAPSGTFIDIPGTNYSYLQENVSASSATNPVHRVTADTSFSAIVYGYGQVESYGYNGGTNVKDLYQYVTTTNQYATINSPVACKSSPFIFSLTLPYIPISMDWTIPGYPNYSVTSPVPDSTFTINGKQLYVFRVPNSYIYNNIGTYPITVTVNNPTSDGCAGIQIIPFPMVVYDPPKPDFSWPNVPASGCVDSVIRFTTNNNGGGRPVIKHFWDFGDNTYAYINNPTKAFTTPGPHTIRYAIMTDAGCLSDTLEKTIYVTNKPTAKFGFTDPQCQGKNITFGDTSKLTGNYGNIVNWNWNLGNGAILNNPNGNNVTTTYPNAIPYTATLQVRTNTGCLSNVYALPVTVRPNPVVNFSNLYACLPDGVVNFTGLSTIADGTQNLFTYLWNFGDAPGPLNSSTVKDPSHKYPALGPYSVKLIVTSNNGCIDSTTKSVANIYPQPKVGIDAPAEVCYQTPVTFQDQTNGITHPVTKWEWRFKNAGGTVIGSSTLKDPVYNFPAPGTYFVQHWAFTNQNCVSDTLEIPIIINPWPSAALTLGAPACEKNQVTLFDNSTPNAGTLVRWYWNLSDGTVINASNGNPINHTYAAWGTKTVKLLVESSKGCKSDTLFQPILINPLPKVGYILPEVCLTDGVATFNDTSNIADGSKAQLKYLWTFNTGTPPVVPAPTPLTSTNKNPTIQFFIAANYQLNLKVESKDGCKDSVNNIPFTVNGVVAKADYKILPTNGLCSNKEVEIQNKSTVVFGWLTKVEIFWDWASNPTQVDVDDVPLVDEIYKHQYPNFQSPATKTYRVRLKAYSGIICQKDTIQDIVVNASPLTKFDPMPGICVDAVPRQITQASELGGLPRLSETYTGPGVNASGLFDPAAAGVGVHTITYTFVATNGCAHSSTSQVEVWPRPVAQLAASLPSCEKNAITFNSNGSQHNAASLTNWNWNFGDASTPVNAGNNTPVKHTYSGYGNYTVNLTVTNNRGCISVPQSLSIKVNPLPKVDFDLPKICLPEGTGQFKNKSTIPDNTQASFKYKWDFGDAFAAPANSDTSSAKDPVYKYRNLGPYTVQLIVTSGNNCMDSLPKQLVEVFPQPKAGFATSEDSICIGGVIDFKDESNGIVSNISRWKWSFDNGDSSFIQNPKYRYPSPATIPYIVKLYVYSDEGCISDTAQKPIFVWDYPKVSAGPDITMLQDGVRKITDARYTGTGLQYLWTPSAYLDNPRSSNPTIVKPQDDITYKVTVTGRGACTTDDEVFVKVLKMPKPPNTFTPNGDGVNDFWEIKYLNDYPGCIVEVYNTAGSLVYRSVGYSTPWDGRFNGQPLPSGTYYYVIDPKNGRSRQAGYVTILK